MPIVTLYGHEALRRRLNESLERGTLPASLLLHGPRGVGKQRLALWLGQRLLCAGTGARPCGSCQHCRYAAELAHPDLHWFFPRPRPDADATPEDIRAEFAEVVAERAQAGGLYPPTSSAEGIFVVTVRTIVQSASLAPAMAKRKVYIVGEAERMVPQESSPDAANAFLKLLEEPPADTTIILTSSEPGALLPTIRSRVVAVRVPPLAAAEVEAFLADPLVHAALKDEGLPASPAERVQLAAGAPGALLGRGSRAAAVDQARRLLEASMSATSADRYRTALVQGGSKARGAYSDALDALTVLLHQRARECVRRGDETGALRAARAVDAVERASGRAAGNVNPQLVSAALLRELGALLR